MKHLFALPIALSIVAGCTDEPLDYTKTTATISERTEGGTAAYAWYQTLSGVSFEAFKPMSGPHQWHHIDVNNYVTGDLAMVVGQHYVDGPAVNGRGEVTTHVGPDGHVHGDVPAVWIDVVACSGDVQAPSSTCVTADSTELWAEEADDGSIRYHYKATLPGDTTPSIEDVFTALPDQVKGVPGV